MIMTANEYLESVLASQQLSDDGVEMQELRDARTKVETLLKDDFAGCSPTIRYGGSKAKGTMIREDYDLDVICYFPNEETGAGETLADIYTNVRDALQEDYATQEKTSSIRLRDKAGSDFHIDVVPGRFTDDSKTDAFLHQTTGDKKRLKTNLQVHIDLVVNSGVTDAIQLMKLWRLRHAVPVRTFVLELITMELLKRKKTASLETKLTHVLTELRDNIDDVQIEDPANPQGNDLSGLLDDALRGYLSTVAGSTLTTVSLTGWEEIFGTVVNTSKAQRIGALRTAAAESSRPTRPWHNGD
jgi:hypothetical protein